MGGKGLGSFSDIFSSKSFDGSRNQGGPMGLFAAAAHAASPFLQRETAKLKEQNDLELREFARNFAIDLDNTIRDTEFNGNAAEYEEKLREFSDRVYGEARTGEKANTSPYYQKMLDRMERDTQAGLKDHALKREDAWRIEQAGTEYTNARTKIKNSNFDMKMSLDEMMAALDGYSSKVGGLSPAARANEQAAIYNELYDKALTIDTGRLTVGQANAQLDRNIAALELAVKERGGTEGALDGWLKNKQERLEEAKGAAQKSIWKRNLNTLDAMDNEYRRVAADAHKTGDNNLLRQAMAMHREGSRLRDQAMRSSEYSPDDRPKIAGMFPATGEISGGSGGRRGGRDEAEKMLKNMMPSFIQAGLDGNFGDPSSPITMYDAKDAFMEAAYSELVNLFDYDGSIEDMRRDFPVVTTFAGKAISAMKERGPEYEGYVMAANSVKKYVEDGFKTNGKGRFDELYKDRKIELMARAEERLWDIVFSDVITKTTGDKVAEEARNFVDTLVAEELNILRVDPKTGKSNLKAEKFETDDDVFAKAVYALSQPDAVWTDTQGRQQYNGIDEDIADDIVTKQMPGRLARELRGLGMDVTAEDVLPGQFTKTEGGRDEDGIVEFRLKDDPGKKYRFVAGKEKNKFTWELQEKSGSSDWEAVAGTKANKQRGAAKKKEERQRSDDLAEKQREANREAVTIANITDNGSPLPMPKGFETSVDDANVRKDKIIEYGGVQKYIEFLKDYYEKQGKPMPKGLEKYL